MLMMLFQGSHRSGKTGKGEKTEKVTEFDLVSKSQGWAKIW